MAILICVRWYLIVVLICSCLILVKQRHYFANKDPSSQGYCFSGSHVWMWKLDYKENWALKNWCFWTGEGSWESLGLQGDPTSPSLRRSFLSVHWKDWWWSWNSSTFATSCKELTHLKRPWCWEGLRVGGERDDRGWDGWMASPTWWTWVWVDSGSWWWTERPSVLWFMGSQRVRHNWATELNISNDDHLFICLLVLCVSSLENCLFRSSHVLTVWCFLLLLICMKYLYILETRPVLVTSFANIFS